MVTTPSQPDEPPLYFHISDSPYENYFYADRIVSCQVVLASPLPRDDHNAPAVHRLLFAWPGGNSGTAVFFEASPEVQDTKLHLRLLTTSHERVLDSVQYEPNENSRSEHPSVGVSGLLEFSNTAILELAILGSVRTVRDYTEGDRILNPKVQGGVSINKTDGSANGVEISRLWFDGKTTSRLTFAPAGSTSSRAGAIAITEGKSKGTIKFAPGVYSFQAHIDYPQSSCMHPTQLLKPAFHHLISQQPELVKSLSFLCTPDKLLAGAWRFLTYFGRDSLISLLLLSPILSEGEYGAIEVGLSAVLDRVNGEDGSVCHEENIGDYPAAQAALNGNCSPDAQYDYKMIDTTFFLPILMEQYFIKNAIGQKRLAHFLRTPATLIPSNVGMNYGQLFDRICEKIMLLAKPFSEPGGQTTHENLIALNEGQSVGQWRDSSMGLGGGRYPYDVNTALMPAALRAIAELVRAGAFDDRHDWEKLARERAEVWETSTLRFFTTKISRQEAKHRLEQYTNRASFPGPCGMDDITEDLCLHAVALKEDGSPVDIMHTDAGFRLLLLPQLIYSSNPTCVFQHLLAIDALVRSILCTFPAGLFTPVGVLIANPAYSVNPLHTEVFTTGSYHGTVVWSWNSLAMLAKGLEVQLSAMAAAEDADIDCLTGDRGTVDFYSDVRTRMKQAYVRIWDTIEASQKHAMAEVWSWRWEENMKGTGTDKTGKFVYVPLSHVPTPDGRRQTESNASQLWSLATLALERRRELEM